VARLVVATSALLALALVAVACGTSGRDLRPPAPNNISPTRSTTPFNGLSTTTTTGVQATTSGALSIASPSVVTGSELPAVFTCTGPSPELRWTGVPAGTRQLALAVIDRDAQDAVQWLVTGMAPADGSVLSGSMPPGAQALTNSFGRAGWNGPCPPTGSTHHYDFVILASPMTVTVAGTTPAPDVFEQLRQAAAGREASMTATVTR
jgi:Raf kinase inhibitor-like YbhB/YbcL family protein